jgi:CheY-like chemotaxis protein
MARILTIDDSRTIIATTRTLLSLDGHEVQSLASFVELPQMLRSWPPDLIILDLNMPMMNGETFGQFIRKHEQRPTPILIYSAAAPERVAQASREIGAAATLPKNRAGDLRRTVSQIVSVSRTFAAVGAARRF